MQSAERSVLTGNVEDITAVVSDIDGTLAHYAKALIPQGYEEVSEDIYRAYEVRAREDAALASLTPVDALLRACYSEEERRARFAGVPCRYWRHNASGRVLRFYELYNLSMSRAVISEKTVQLVELLQCPEKLYHGLGAAPAGPGVLFALITGARTSTFRYRRQSRALPQTAFDVCEGGGKIWSRLRAPQDWPWRPLQTHAAVPQRFYDFAEAGELDRAWVEKFAPATGYHGTSDAEKPDRAAPMWQLEAALNAEGYRTDHREFDTSFQIYIAESPCVGRNDPEKSSRGFPRTFETPVEAEEYLRRVFAEEYKGKYGVTLFINLGRGQVNADGCGKREAMLRLLADCQRVMTGERVDVFCPAHSLALFDDSNDIPFAELCGVGLLPSVTHTEVLAHSMWQDAAHRRWFRPPVDGPLGSEWALEQIVLFKRDQARHAAPA